MRRVLALQHLCDIEGHVHVQAQRQQLVVPPEAVPRRHGSGNDPAQLEHDFLRRRRAHAHGLRERQGLAEAAHNQKHKQSVDHVAVQVGPMNECLQVRPKLGRHTGDRVLRRHEEVVPSLQEPDNARDGAYCRILLPLQVDLGVHAMFGMQLLEALHDARHQRLRTRPIAALGDVRDEGLDRRRQLGRFGRVEVDLLMRGIADEIRAYAFCSFDGDDPVAPFIAARHVVQQGPGVAVDEADAFRCFPHAIGELEATEGKRVCEGLGLQVALVHDFGVHARLRQPMHVAKAADNPRVLVVDAGIAQVLAVAVEGGVLFDGGLEGKLPLQGDVHVL
mmetsp:Transcript_38155/g.115349  ORF Transcript_38155/g.115349 Transcript_38155/m.115349 type:complete len:334 (-) Transcript_38155:1817-2818(-)